MTVTVGIYCTNGVVIAADSALTVNGIIEQTYPKKVACIPHNLIVGFAGDLSFAQRYRQIIQNFWNPESLAVIENLETYEVIKHFCRSGMQEFIETQQAGVSINIPASFIIGFVHRGKHNLVLLPHGGFQPIVINENFPSASLGSGNFITDPFLSFVREVFWEGKKSPDLSVGIFSAVMALNLAIQVNSGGINGPIHVAVIEKINDEKYIYKKLDEDDIAQHQENYKNALSRFSSYKHIFNEANIENAISIPTAPNWDDLIK